MNGRLAELTRQKEYLIARCARERDELTRCSEKLHAPIRLAVLFMGVVRILKAYPEIVIGISGFLARDRVGRLSGLTRTTRRLLVLLPVFRSLASWWSKRRSRG